MKLTKICFAFLLPVVINLKIFSQELYPGQYLPYRTIHNVLNYKSNQINLKDFKGKLVIIDFWGIFCSSCLEKFNELDSLQHELNGEVQIILVNRDDLKKTKLFFQTHSKIKIPRQIPLVTSDTLFHNYFPHDGVPSYVWIDTIGKVLYKTDETISQNDIVKYLHGEPLEISGRIMEKFVPSLFDENFQNTIQYATYFAKAIDTLNVHIDYNNDNIPYNAHSIEELYQFAYNKSDNEGYYKYREPGRTILNVKDTIKYRFLPGINYDKWRSQYSYYYHEMLPERLKKDKYDIMKSDLQRFFDLNATVEQRPVKCLELIRTSSLDKLKTKGGNSTQTDFSFWLAAKNSDIEHPPVRFIRNKPFHNLVDIIQGFGYSQFQTKIVDSTGYIGNIDFEMNEDLLNNLTIEKLKNELRKYDLDLVEKNILMDVLILSEKE